MAKSKEFIEGFDTCFNSIPGIVDYLIKMYWESVDRKKVSPEKMLSQFPEFVKEILPYCIKVARAQFD